MKGITNEEIFEPVVPEGGRWQHGNTMRFETECNGGYADIQISFLKLPNMSLKDIPIRRMKNGKYAVNIIVVGPTYQLVENHPDKTTNATTVAILQ